MSPSPHAPPAALPVPTRARWVPLRAGIHDVWEYDDQRFVFTGGRLLLRGQNEAGKTKAMELLFPLLLDADLSPQRLDPFGTTSRSMRWNLFNDLNPTQELRVGYVWLELGRLVDGEPAYLTLGAGFRAKRLGTDLDDWFFLTSQRLDLELTLAGEDRRARTRADLEAALGAAGQVFERHADYRRAVNSRLFGMAEEQYDALLDTLLALRRPQLSKALDLEQLSGFLSSALPPLDPQVLAPIAEGFERLDHHRSDLEARAATLADVRRFDGHHRAYARAVAKGFALDLTRAESAWAKLRAQAREAAARRDASTAERDGLVARLAALEEEAHGLDQRVRALEGSEEYRAGRELDRAEQEARRAEAHREGVGARAGRDARDEAEATAEVDRQGAMAGRARAGVESARAEAVRLAEAAALAAVHGAVDEPAGRGEPEATRAALSAIAAEREATIASLRALQRELRRAEEAHRLAEELLRARDSEARDAETALRAAETEARRRLDGWRAAATTWLGGLAVLPAGGLPEPDADEVEERPGLLAERAAAAAEPVRATLAEARASAAARQEFLEVERARLAGEREALARAAHPTPAPPPWRPARPPGRPGAPLYLLCDFGPAAAGREAGLEAALEAAGLLDAWVTPEGELLDPATEDVILEGPPAAGTSLTKLLAPVAAHGVSLEAAARALGSIGLAPPGGEGDGACWVSADGRWRLGPARGAWHKAAAGFIGATAREEERARRIAALDERLAAVEADARAAGLAVSQAEEALARLQGELAALPRHAPVDEARVVASLQAEGRTRAVARRGEAEGQAAGAADAATRAASALDAEAVARGVRAFARDADRLADLTRAWSMGGNALVVSLTGLVAAVASLGRSLRASEEAAGRAAGSREELDRARLDAAGATARAAALREAVGGALDEVLAALAEARERIDATHAERRRAGHERARLDEAVGAARTASEKAEAEVAAADEVRQEAARALRRHAAAGLLSAAGLEAPAEPDGWTYTTTLDEARRVDAAAESGATVEEREKAEDRLLRASGELDRQLPPGTRLEPSRHDGVLRFAFFSGGRGRTPAEVVAELEAEVTARSALLGSEEAGLLERFLSGEAHDHLATRLRQARDLVDRMNRALEARTTAAGSQVRLAWRTDDGEALSDARAAVPLFLLSGHLLSEANRATLRGFLEARLAQARDAAGERALQDRLLGVLDYRSWHRFRVEFREPGRPWAPLTKKAHGAGSGGRKAVMLHLPLFAAAAAFYDAAGPDAPRLIALDEAFAGIDRPTRGRLMGLLAEFDLDFLMTSFEEWGCYAELDGLSTYHLSREPGHRGVHGEWFVWNGRERVLVDAP